TGSILRMKTKHLQDSQLAENGKPKKKTEPPEKKEPVQNRCYNCDADHSMSGWLPKIDDGRTACNKCWLYWRRRGIHRPKVLSAEDLRVQSLEQRWLKKSSKSRGGPSMHPLSASTGPDDTVSTVIEGEEGEEVIQDLERPEVVPAPGPFQEGEERKCYNCGTRTSKSYPRIADGRRTCSRSICWVYNRRHGVDRPDVSTRMLRSTLRNGLEPNDSKPAEDPRQSSSFEELSEGELAEPKDIEMDDD
ncbi:hypothetical protein C8J56DRAFT_937612, partial [Mycena floridula]